MNIYTQNLDRIEFLITFACTGKCKHCSEGEHTLAGEHINGDIAAEAVRKVAQKYDIQSLMTFGGEPLLRPDDVCKIHAAAREAGIPKRELITNGFFSRDTDKIRQTAQMLVDSGVEDILLSVDSFHQETIPLSPVVQFATEAIKAGIPRLRAHPAWLVNEKADNPYNRRTREILSEFQSMGISVTEGNIIFPSGNARKYLKEYFDDSIQYVSPYAEDPHDIRAICVGPNGDVLGGNIYQSDIIDILNSYGP